MGLKQRLKAAVPAGIKDAYWTYLTRRRNRVRPLGLTPSSRGSGDSPYPFAVAEPNLLKDLGDKYRPTKTAHAYLRYYWLHFRDIREHVKNVCEIGVQSGKSMLMWEEFFPNATIHGVDIDPECRKLEGGRRKVWIGNQGDPAFWDAFLRDLEGGLDIVIDDGSHMVNHQLRTFEMLFPVLSRHGIYVIEDVGGSVADFELQTANEIKKLVDNVMYWPEGYDPARWMDLSSFPASATWADCNIVGVAFYRDIIFVMRGDNPGDNPCLHRS